MTVAGSGAISSPGFRRWCLSQPLAATRQNRPIPRNAPGARHRPGAGTEDSGGPRAVPPYHPFAPWSARGTGQPDRWRAAAGADRRVRQPGEANPGIERAPSLTREVPGNAVGRPSPTPEPTPEQKAAAAKAEVLAVLVESLQEKDLSSIALCITALALLAALFVKEST